MNDDGLDYDLGRELRAFSGGGIRRIDARLVAETAIRRRAQRRFIPAWSPAPGMRVAGTMAIALAAVVLVAVVADYQRGTSRTGVAPPSSESPAPVTPQPTDTIPLRPFEIETRAGVVRLMVPAGWRVADHEQAVYTGDEPYPNSSGPMLAVQDVTTVVTDTCPNGSRDPAFLPVGETVKDLTTALQSMDGLERAGPIKIPVGGHPAQRLVLSLPDDFEIRCGGPEGRILWQNATMEPFGLLNGGTATVYVVDVDGVRLVIATHYRGATREQQLELARLIASIEIDSAGVPPQVNMGPDRELPLVRHPVNVDGIAFSFEIASRWEQFGSISLNKNIRGPQGAEAMIYWTGFPQGQIADLCRGMLDLPADDRSTADLGAAVATAPGTQLVAAPSAAEVGGFPASRTVVRVREENGCDPGFFHTWDDVESGAVWTRTPAGSTIRVWIVEVDGKRLFIGGVSAPDAGRELEQEIESIVESIRFE